MTTTHRHSTLTHRDTDEHKYKHTYMHTCKHTNNIYIYIYIYIYTHIMYIFYTCIEIYNHTLPDLTLSVYCTTLPYHTYNITLHYMMLHDTLHCVIALPYIPFHYLTLHDTTLQYIPQLFPDFFSYVPQLFHNSSTTVPIWTVDYIHLIPHPQVLAARPPAPPAPALAERLAVVEAQPWVMISSPVG